MTRILFIVLFILILKPGVAQQINGLVMDNETGDPLPYVHIGIHKKGIGTISDEAGRFTLSLSEKYIKDTIVFSMVGYQSFYLKLNNRPFNPKNIRLKPSSIQLHEVVVTEKKGKKPIYRFGQTKPTKIATGATGFEIRDYGVGQEIGTVIKNDGESYVINAISFHHKSNTLDSILYRVNIYDLKYGKPANSLIQNQLFVVANKREKWIHLNIEDQFFIFNKDLFVSIELVQRWNNQGNNRLFYSHGTGCDECENFIRPVSQANWTRNFAFPLTLYLTVEKLKSR